MESLPMRQHVERLDPNAHRPRHPIYAIIPHRERHSSDCPLS